MPQIAASNAEIIVMADADVWCDGIRAAVEAIRGDASWAIPHRGVYRLDEKSTADYMDGAALTELEFTQRPYRGVAGGGIVAARREVFIQTPMDCRFIGWGQEDESWGMALETLNGRPWRGGDRLIHLWHPPQDRLTRRTGSSSSRNLERRYAAANGKPSPMRDLIEEAKDANRAAYQSALQDRASLTVGHD